MTVYAVVFRRALLGVNRLGTRSISELVKPDLKGHFLIDNWALMERLGAKGLPSKQAEAVMEVITEMLNDRMERISRSSVSKNEMQKNEMTQESNFCNFKSAVKASQDQHFTLLQHENEKFKSVIEKIRSELSSEIDRVAAEQRLQFNVERRKFWEAVNRQTQDVVDRSNNLDRENQVLRSKLEAAKFTAFKYSLGTLASTGLVGLAAVYVVKSGALPF